MVAWALARSTAALRFAASRALTRAMASLRRAVSFRRLSAAAARRLPAAALRSAARLRDLKSVVTVQVWVSGLPRGLPHAGQVPNPMVG